MSRIERSRRWNAHVAEIARDCRYDEMTTDALAAEIRGDVADGFTAGLKVTVAILYRKIADAYPTIPMSVSAVADVVDGL